MVQDLAQDGPRLDGYRLLITGAAAGIGLAIAEMARSRGARVFVLDSDAAAVQALGPDGCAVDVTDEAGVNVSVAAAAVRMGGIDAVINSAGVMHRGSLAEVDGASWRRVIDINLTGPYLVARAALPHLQASDRASIINIASAQALLPNSANRSAYCASKGGVLNLTRSLAAELAPGIRVNSVCPGLVDTPMANGVRQNIGNYAMGRLARPEEIAAAVLFLLGPGAEFITGAALAVDGGRSFH